MSQPAFCFIRNDEYCALKEICACGDYLWIILFFTLAMIHAANKDMQVIVNM